MKKIKKLFITPTLTLRERAFVLKINEFIEAFNKHQSEIYPEVHSTHSNWKTAPEKKEPTECKHDQGVMTNGEDSICIKCEKGWRR